LQKKYYRNRLREVTLIVGVWRFFCENRGKRSDNGVQTFVRRSSSIFLQKGARMIIW